MTGFDLPGIDLPGFDLAAFIEATLAEDLGGVADASRDLTANACLAPDARLSAVLDSRDAVVVAGLPIAAAFVRRRDPDCRVELLVADGDAVTAGADLMRVEGNARALLAAERSALNTLQHLCGIATLTRAYVAAIAGTGCTLLDTRKTLPGLRMLEKYAVRMGGGSNHRMGLWDAPMVKDNHIAAAGGVTEAVAGGRAGGLREAVALVAGRVPTEASGGVNLETIRGIAETGVTFVSVGRITQSAPAADVGMDFA